MQQRPFTVTMMHKDYFLSGLAFNVRMQYWPKASSLKGITARTSTSAIAMSLELLDEPFCPLLQLH